MVAQTKSLENAVVGEGGVSYTCAVERLDTFLVLFTAGKRGAYYLWATLSTVSPWRMRRSFMTCSWIEVGDGCWRFAALGPERENPVTAREGMYSPCYLI